MKSTIQIKQISGLIFSLIGFFVCNNHNVFAESLSMTLNGVDAGNELNFDFDKGAHEAAKVRDILMNVRTDNRSGYKVMISSAGADSILPGSSSPMLVVNKATASAPGVGDSSGAGIPKNQCWSTRRWRSS